MNQIHKPIRKEHRRRAWHQHAVAKVIRDNGAIRFASCCAFVILSICTGNADTWSKQTTRDSEVEWLTGKAREESNQFGVSASWLDVPLRSRLMQMSKLQNVAIFLDRRIDPQQLISMTRSGITLEQFIWRVAEDNGLGACLIGDVYYLGPPETAASLPIVVAQLENAVAKMPKDSRRRWQKKRSLSWGDIAEPQQILNQILNEAEVACEDRLSYDLWFSGDWPAMTLSQNLSLIAVGFEQAVQPVDKGSRFQLIDFPNDANGKVVFSQRKIAPAIAKQIKRELKTAIVSNKGTRLSVNGSSADVAKAKAMLVAAQVPLKRAQEDQIYNLKVLAQRKQILNQIASVTMRKLEYSDSIEDRLQARVNLEQSGVSLKELIEATLEGSGLSFDLTDDAIKIYE